MDTYIVGGFEKMEENWIDYTFKILLSYQNKTNYTINKQTKDKNNPEIKEK